MLSAFLPLWPLDQSIDIEGEIWHGMTFYGDNTLHNSEILVSKL